MKRGDYSGVNMDTIRGERDTAIFKFMGKDAFPDGFTVKDISNTEGVSCLFNDDIKIRHHMLGMILRFDDVERSTTSAYACTYQFRVNVYKMLHRLWLVPNKG